jgi:hypothetical protein
LLVGAGVSSTDIANDIGPFAKKIYQVARGGPYDIPAQYLPSNAERVPEIASFADVGGIEQGRELQDDVLKPIPSSITVKDGRILKDIHTVIVCTGYLISYPFLRHLHSDTTTIEEADEKVLITDGTMLHNLHKDIFYIPDPSLAFVGTAYSVTSFALFEYQAIATAAVFCGRVRLPSQRQMRNEYKLRVLKNGLGRRFHTLKDEEVPYVTELVTWLNKGRLVKPIEGYSEQWLVKYKERREWLKQVFAGKGPA